MNLRARFILILVGLTLTPIILAGALVAWWSFDDHRRLIRAFHREALNLAEERLVTNFDRYEQELSFMAFNLDLAHRTPNQVRTALAMSLSRHRGELNAFNRIAVTDERGRVVVGLSRPDQPPDPAWPAVLKLPETGGLKADSGAVFGPVEFTPGSGEPLITLAKPVFQRRGGRLRGWLAVQIQLDRVWERAVLRARARKTDLYLLDGRHRLLAHPDKSLVKAGTIFRVQPGLNTGRGLSGRRALISATAFRLGGRPLVIVAERKWLEAYRPVLIQLGVVIMVVAAAALGIILAGALLLKDVVRPMERLGRAARAMGGGDLSARVESGRDDEVGQLAVAFNTMAARLEENMTALRQQVDERAEAYKNLDRSYRELEDFAHVAAHHLQEPLRKMASFGELLDKRYGDQLDERGRRYLWYIIDGAARLKALLEDLLIYTQAGRAKLNLEEIDLEALVSDTVAQFQGIVEKKGARITWDELPRVKVDPAKFQMVIRALVDNALKFCDHGSPEVHLAAEVGKDRWALSVTDNGCGVEPAYQAQIFDLFETLHPVGKYPGTGIGLALCRRIVEMHRGRLWIESQPGGGSTIRLTLPLKVGGAR